MFGDLQKYITVLLVGFVVSYVLTPLVRALAFHLGVVDKPDERRPHKRITPRGGGLAVVLGVHAGCLAALFFSWPQTAGAFSFIWWRQFALASLVLLIVGIVDDVRGMRPLVKLGGQALAALLISYAGVHFGAVFGIEINWLLDRALVIIWLLAIINAFNLIDGLDGLASGLAIISAAGLCGIFIIEGMPGNTPVLLALIGACLAFLRYNFNPATIFLGDTGSMFLGFSLGVISLQTFNKSTFVFSLTIPLMVLGVPIYDALLAIWRRSARMWLSGTGPGKRRGIMQPDLDHLHHRLVKAGISTRRVALLLCFGNLSLVVFGLLITMFRSHASGIFLVAFLAGAYVVIRHLSLIELRDTGTVLLGGIRRPTHATVKALAGPVWDMLWLSGAVALCMRLTETSTEGFWHRWFLDLPVWVTPTFSLLAISNSYVTVWSRARMRDLLKLAVTLELGVLISLGIALLIDPYSTFQKWVLWTLVIAAFSHPAMLGARVIYRVAEEVVTWSKSKSEPPAEGARVLLYGAGGRCLLFLRERGFQSLSGSDSRQIAGMIDDDASLHSQYVYGYRVLGAGKDLPRLVTAHRINGVIITALLSKEAREALEALAAQLGLPLTEWRCQEERVAPMAGPPMAPLPETPIGEEVAR